MKRKIRIFPNPLVTIINQSHVVGILASLGQILPSLLGRAPSVLSLCGIMWRKCYEKKPRLYCKTLQESWPRSQQRSIPKLQTSWSQGWALQLCEPHTYASEDDASPLWAEWANFASGLSLFYHYSDNKRSSESSKRFHEANGLCKHRDKINI